MKKVISDINAGKNLRRAEAAGRTALLNAGFKDVDYLTGKADIAVMVTNRRALGFSAFTGGFFPQDLPAGNQIQKIEINDNVVILHLSGIMLVFRSGLAIWAELP